MKDMTHKKYKVLALLGKSGAGKNKVLDYICKSKKYNRIIASTTRPIREYELEGVDYYFLSKAEMFRKIAAEDILEVSFHNDWVYATDLQTLNKNKINVGIFNPKALECLIEEYRKGVIDLIVIDIQASPIVRLNRILTRENATDVTEVLRRYNADEKDFMELEEDYYDYQIDNNSSFFETKIQLSKILKEIKRNFI